MGLKGNANKYNVYFHCSPLIKEEITSRAACTRLSSPSITDAHVNELHVCSEAELDASVSALEDGAADQDGTSGLRRHGLRRRLLLLLPDSSHTGESEHEGMTEEGFVELTRFDSSVCRSRLGLCKQIGPTRGRQVPPEAADGGFLH